MYIGDFAGSDIRIILNYVGSTKALGYNIHKGLQRNIMGSVQRNGDTVQMILQEPGDNEYDGVFTLNFIHTTTEPEGKWVPNDKKLSSKSFKLKKIVFDQEDFSRESLDLTNFSSIFGSASDTLGDYRFEKDGYCTFSYYPKGEERSLEQMQTIKGTWTLDGLTVIIDWEKNDHFPTRTLKLKAVQNVHEDWDYREWELIGEGDYKIWERYYP